jgi:hypothetical protein
MGIGIQTVDTIGREHAYRPISGDVLFVGRQTVYATPDELAATLRVHGHRVDRSAIEVDRSTVNRHERHAHKTLAADRSIFRALGIDSVRALDVSAYEGAEIVHDLNRPLPPDLEQTVDFLLDGSTLDNVFDPAMAIRNFAGLLRPGGRLLTINGYSTRETAYTICSPPWFFDYFVENGFADCKVYVTVARGDRTNVFWLDPDYLEHARQAPLLFHTNDRMWTTVFAEKAAASTVDKSPVQQHYRSAAGWDAYCGNLARVKQSQRPHLHRSSTDLFLNRALAGYPWIDREFSARRHWRQIPHRAYWKIRRTVRALRAQPAPGSSKP